MSSKVRRQGAAGALWASGLIHLLALPEHLVEAPALGALFAMQAAATAILGWLLWHRDDERVWYLAGALCAVTTLAYLASRTVGLPGMGREAWDGVGGASLLSQAAFLVGYRARHLVVRARDRRLAVGLPLLALAIAGAVPVLAYSGYSSGGSGTMATGASFTQTAAALTPAAPFQMSLTVPPVLTPDSIDASTDYYAAS